MSDVVSRVGSVGLGVRGALLAMFALVACGPATPIEVPFRVRSVAREGAFDDATRLTVAVNSVGPRPLSGYLTSSAYFYLPTTELFMYGTHVFGGPFQLYVEAVGPAAEVGQVVLGSGRSMPFRVDPPNDTGLIVVWVGEVGRFAMTLDEPLDGSVSAVSRTADGALVATRTGAVYHYRAQAGPEGLPELVTETPAPQGADAAFAAVPNVGLLAVGGAFGGASLLDPSPSRSLDADTPLHGFGAGFAVDPDGTRAWLVGGSTSVDGPAVDTITRIEVIGDSLAAVTEPARLPWPLADAEAIVVPVRDDQGGFGTRLFVVGGRTGDDLRTEAALIDPMGDDDVVLLDLGEAQDDAAVAVLDTNLCLVAGGRRADGSVTNRVTVFAVQPGALEPVSPAPAGGRMTVPRAGAAAVSFAPGLVLIAGGQGADGGALSSVELVDTRIFPGDVVPTGPLPFAAAAPKGVLLWNGAVLVATEQGLAEYITPPVEVP